MLNVNDLTGSLYKVILFLCFEFVFKKMRLKEILVIKTHNDISRFFSTI